MSYNHLTSKRGKLGIKANETGSKVYQMNALSTLGYIQTRAGQYESAIESMKRTLVLAESIGLKEEITNCCYNIGFGYTSLEKLTEAHQYFKKAVESYETLLEQALGAQLGGEDADKTYAACYRKKHIKLYEALVFILCEQKRFEKALLACGRIRTCAFEAILAGLDANSSNKIDPSKRISIQEIIGMSQDRTIGE